MEKSQARSAPSVKIDLKLSRLSSRRLRMIIVGCSRTVNGLEDCECKIARECELKIVIFGTTKISYLVSSHWGKIITFSILVVFRCFYADASMSFFHSKQQLK